MFIHGLPDVLLREIYSEWIGLKSLGKIDCALTNHSIRQNFLDILSSEVAFHKRAVAVVTPIPILLWCSLRNVKLDQLFVDNKYFENAKFKFFGFNLSQVTHLEIGSGLSPSTFCSFVNCCPSLKSVVMAAFTSSAFVFKDLNHAIGGVRPEILSQLTAMYKVIERELDCITENCSNLTTLYVHGGLSDLDSIAPLLNKNKKIKYLEVSDYFAEGVFESLIKQFPHLPTVIFQYASYGDSSDRGNQLLRNLEVPVQKLIIKVGSSMAFHTLKSTYGYTYKHNEHFNSFTNCLMIQFSLESLKACVTDLPVSVKMLEFYNTHNLTADFLIEVLTQNPNIEHIQLSYCFTDRKFIKKLYKYKTSTQRNVEIIWNNAFILPRNIVNNPADIQIGSIFTFLDELQLMMFYGKYSDDIALARKRSKGEGEEEWDQDAVYWDK